MIEYYRMDWHGIHGVYRVRDGYVERWHVERWHPASGVWKLSVIFKDEAAMMKCGAISITPAQAARRTRRTK